MNSSSSRSHTSGAVLNIECEIGYMKSSNPECRQGHWTHVQCKPSSCQNIPIIANADDLSHCQNTGDAERCWYHCLTGFHRNGILACYLGQWTQPTCESTLVKRECWDTPYVENSQDLWNCRGTSSGDSCELQCNEGYYAVGELLCINGQFY